MTREARSLTEAIALAGGEAKTKDYLNYLMMLKVERRRAHNRGKVFCRVCRHYFQPTARGIRAHGKKYHNSNSYLDDWWQATTHNKS